jgi:hypothetical protein
LIFLTSVISLLPVMQIHLLESTSSKSTARRMGEHNLGICMIAMEDLRKSYISAEAAYKLFEAAIKKINTTRPAEPSVQLPPISPAITASPPVEPPPPTELNGWPDGYGLSTAGIVSDFLAPFPSTYPEFDPETQNFYFDLDAL